MRKAKKRQVEEMVKTLGQANEEIRRALARSRRTMAMSLLEKCQQGAVALGTAIEQDEGEDCAAVRLLEEYCELVYRLHEKLRRGLTVKAEEEYNNLYDSVMRIENSVRLDIKERLEVVFLPYKASMWDSLESVWRAADEDPDCDAYVIPIPYYDKDPDGNFREMHYEGGLYPKDVPVVWYEDYDLARRKPDAIFIHNPYDGFNIVTSVHPDFYSGKLKEHTEMLVYIPYFVLNEVDPEDTQAVKNLEHLIIISAEMNADKVVVQSEAMRQVYIDTLTRCTGKHTRKKWEEKILGIGSPKIDKVLNTAREDIEIPDEWMRVIRKADGSRKKIIFYNTGISALLKFNEKVLEKMETVFKTFRENRDEIALLWRPHPLLKATIASMYPHLCAAYEKIVEEYRSEGWGIYDDTADLDRAVILSDAYYGDGSSVVQLCLKAGKPVMVQYPDIP